MKKLIIKLLFIFSLLGLSISWTFASWTINDDTIFTTASWSILTECSENDIYVWVDLFAEQSDPFSVLLTESDLNNACWENVVEVTWSWSIFLGWSWVLNVVSDKISNKVPTAFEGSFWDYIADLFMLWLIILWIIVFKRVTWVSKDN